MAGAGALASEPRMGHRGSGQGPCPRGSLSRGSATRAVEGRSIPPVWKLSTGWGAAKK